VCVCPAPRAERKAHVARPRARLVRKKKSRFAARSLELIVDDANAKATIPCVKRHCDIELLLALLPPSLYESIVGIKRFEDRLVAISLNVGSKPKARVASEDQERTETECVKLHM
jgi:hypothetical protein